MYNKEKVELFVSETEVSNEKAESISGYFGGQLFVLGGCSGKNAGYIVTLGIVQARRI